MNPLFSGNTPSGFSVNPQIAQLARLAKNGANPQAIVSQFPQLQQVMQMCNGANPRDVFYKMCEQRGIDPNTILSQLQ